jgi:hypothetical protein
MHRRAVVAGLAAATTTGLAGCSGAGFPGSDGATVAGRFDESPERPECEVDSETIEVAVGGETREYETAATIPYPGPPAEFGEAAVVKWVTAFEEAYVTHRALCDRSASGHVLEMTYGVDRAELLDRPDDWLAVYLRYVGGASEGVDDTGGVWAADLDHSAVAYAVDETGAARVALDDPTDPSDVESAVPDPVDEGELVAVFE